MQKADLLIALGTNLNTYLCTQLVNYYEGEKLVVAEFMVQAADTVDSVWVKVARDQETMGWVRGGELLKKVGSG